MAKEWLVFIKKSEINSRSTCMEIYWPAVAIAACVTILLGVWMTHPEELRPRRWGRILVTLPFTCWIANAFATPIDLAQGMFSFFWSFFVAFFWRDVFAHYVSDQIMKSMIGFSPFARGVEVDLQYVKSAIRFGETDRAVELLEEELEKEPYSYEGLLLLSSLNAELKRWEAAIAPLGLLLENGRLSHEQRAHVGELKKKLEDSLLVEQLNAR
jgi:hypothetical protein